MGCVARPPTPPTLPFSWAVTFIFHGGVKALSESLSFYEKKTVKTDHDLEVAVELLRCSARPRRCNWGGL